MLLVRDHFLWLLGSLCQLHRVPFDPKLVLQSFSSTHSIATLLEAGKALGFRLGRAALNSSSLQKVPTPFIAFLKPNGEVAGPHALADDAAQNPPPAARPVLIVNMAKEQVLYFEAGTQTPLTCNLPSIPALFEEECYLVALEAKTEEPVDGASFSTESFGFRWFAKELLKHKTVWKNVLAASLAIQIIGLTTPLFTQVIIDKVVVHQTQSTLIAIAVALLMFMVFTAGMSWLRQYLVLHTGNRVDAVLGSQVFRHLLRVSLRYFEQRPTGVLVARLQAVENIRQFMAGAAVSLILDFPFLLIFLAVMFWYSWELSLIAVGILTAIAVFGFAITPALRNRLNNQFLLGARNQAFLTEYVSGIETVKSLQMEPRLESRYDDYLATFLAAGFSTRQLSNTYNVVANALEQTMTLAILCVGALLVMRNDGFTIGMLVAFQMFASRMSQPMLRLAGLWQEFQQANISMKRLGDIMDQPTERYSVAPSRTSDGPGKVELSDLAFRYNEESPFLFKNLQITLKPGRLMLLTGPSGSGKSTLAKLLLGFYMPAQGRILIDGRDIRHFSANELRQYYGMVPQETYLFSGTLYENLISASPHAGFDDVVRACKVAEIHDFIEKLPQGYNNLVGEHGVGLSGGQKQRIAIARAVLKRPKILVFDEATSNLDRATAEQFARTVNQLRGTVTMLFISHQVPKGLQVDDIYSFGPKGTLMSVVDEQN